VPVAFIPSPPSNGFHVGSLFFHAYGLAYVLAGSERLYHALRLAGALAKREEVELHLFLLGEAVACAVAGQQLPESYHLDRMLKPLVRGGEVACCGTCMDARALTQEQLVEGAHRASGRTNICPATFEPGEIVHDVPKLASR
jgi:uncharacterized protein involved in oxidation of intracellular sulfur